MALEPGPAAAPRGGSGGGGGGDGLALCAALLVTLVAVALPVILAARWRPEPPALGLARTLCRLLCCRGRRAPGRLTGMRFPVRLADLLGPEGPALLTEMLRCGQGRLPEGEAAVRDEAGEPAPKRPRRQPDAGPVVTSVRLAGGSSAASVRDGVKGEKAILRVEYEGQTELPGELFVKFNLQQLGPMRLLVETSEVCRCEALFYHHLAAEVAPLIASPRCLFVDYSPRTGEFALLTEVVRFGEGGVLPQKHRVRDATSLEELRRPDGVGTNVVFTGGSQILDILPYVALSAHMLPYVVMCCHISPHFPHETCFTGTCGTSATSPLVPTPSGSFQEEQRLFVERGARLHARLWGAGNPRLPAGVPRFEETHRQMWLMAQLTARLGLHHTMRRTLRGRRLNEAFMTWATPPELLGREAEIIGDMPGILRSLCEDGDMVAFGHNDLFVDNAYLSRDGEGRLGFGAFDWQQSCLNNVGQEWAWNFHFLDPAFLDANEAAFVDLILKTYAEEGIQVSRSRFSDRTKHAPTSTCADE